MLSMVNDASAARFSVSTLGSGKLNSRSWPQVQVCWPDDKEWYLIQLDYVDPHSRKAQCVPGPGSSSFCVHRHDCI